MDALLIRGRAERLLKEHHEAPLTEEEWQFALSREWLASGEVSPLETEEQLDEVAETLVEHVREWRELHGRVDYLRPPAAPSWWAAEAEARLLRHERTRRRLLAIFDLMEGDAPHFLKVDEVAGFVAAVHRQEQKTGDALVLHVPIAWVPVDEGASEHVLESEALLVWRGTRRSDLHDEQWLRPPTRLERAQEQRLSRLAELSEWLAHRIGCHPAEAVAFLLCDHHPHTPWVEASYSREHDGYVLIVRDVRVTPTDVARAYRHQRDVLGIRTRAPLSGPLAVVEHVDAEMKGSHFSWPEAYESFSRKHGKRYTFESFRNTYYRKRSR